MLDDMLSYIENIRQRPVWQPIPLEVRARFQERLPYSAGSLAAAHQSFMSDVAPYAVGNVHPGFMGWVHGGGTPVGMVADMLAAGLNANLAGRDQMPVEVERQIVSWMRELFQFPDAASGIFVTGTSMANLMGLLVARTAVLGTRVRQAGLQDQGPRLVAYTSAAAHGCIAQAMDLSGLGTAALRRIRVNAGHQIDLAALDMAIVADRDAGLQPFFIAGTAGTVDVGAVDDLSGLADLAQRNGLWFHVDGAYGALGMLAPDIAPLLAGIERADSLAFDFHKWGQVPYDAGFLLVREASKHLDAFAAPAAYLQRETRGLAGGSPWPCDFGPDLSRAFRALKTWFTFKVYGGQRLGQVLSETCRLARYLAAQVEASPALELLAPVTLNIVCFRYRCADSDSVNREIVIDLQESGIAVPSTTTIDGKLAIRAAIVNHRTGAQDIDTMLAAVVAIGGRRVPDSALNDPGPDSIESAAVPFAPLIGVARLARRAFLNEDLAPLGTALLGRATEHPTDANAFLDCSTILQLTGDRDIAMSVQAQAIQMRALYSLPARQTGPGLRLLVIMGPGDLMSNTPIEFLVEDSDVSLDMLYLTAESEWPDSVPDHDVMMVALGESPANQPLLHRLAGVVDGWSQSIINLPQRIAVLSRDGVCAALRNAPGVDMPTTVRTDRAALLELGSGRTPLAALLPDADFPLIVRPIGSHAGQGLEKILSASDLTAYLERVDAERFYASPFVDYRGADGVFRKYRIALIEGRAFVCHYAMSEHWMIAYFNAGMAESANKRAEEADCMAHFDEQFAVRHAAALQAIHERMGLPYVALDCAENRAGDLLIFEVDNAMVVHAMDPEDMFPYKKPAMRKVFVAFRQMLENARQAA
jgi:aromatic-L-amino-acid decarboxylase